jgi:hypothetical protein
MFALHLFSKEDMKVSDIFVLNFRPPSASLRTGLCG